MALLSESYLLTFSHVEVFSNQFVLIEASSSGKDDGFGSVELIEKKSFATRTISEKIQVFMMQMMKKLGFWGILLAASVSPTNPSFEFKIPNPLFDLAGIMCGHFAIPFYTFFGATFVGKAVIKSSIQV